ETSVVLPAPVEPMIATVSPGSARNEMPERIGCSAPGYVNDTSSNTTDPGPGMSVTGRSGGVTVVSLLSTSEIRSAETAARGIMIAMKLAIMTPPRIWPTYCMKANSVPIWVLPASTSTPPNHTTAMIVTLSTSMTSGNMSTNSEPTLRPTIMMSVLAT